MGDRAKQTTVSPELCRDNQEGTGGKAPSHELEVTEGGDLSRGRGSTRQSACFLKTQGEEAPTTTAAEKLGAALWQQFGTMYPYPVISL